MLSTGLACANHPAVPATRYCVGCGARTCGACTTTKDFGRVKMEVCGGCGGLVRALDPIEQAREHGDRALAERLRGPAFWQRPLDLVRYPFSGPAGPVAMIAFAIAQAAIISFGRLTAMYIFAALVFHGLIFSYAMHCARRVELGEEKVGSPMDFENVWDDAYAPTLRMAATMLPALVGVVIVIVAAGGEPAHMRFGAPGPMALFVFNLLMLPGALLQAASHGSLVDLLNPIRHARVLARAPGDYLAALGLTVLVAGGYLVWYFAMPISRALTLEAIDGALETLAALVLARVYGLFLRRLQTA